MLTLAENHQGFEEYRDIHKDLPDKEVDKRYVESVLAKDLELSLTTSAEVNSAVQSVQYYEASLLFMLNHFDNKSATNEVLQDIYIKNETDLGKI